jgi:hypothetical protein
MKWILYMGKYKGDHTHKELTMKIQSNLAYKLCRAVAKGTVIIRGAFEKFVDSPYYSELELCRGAMTVSFSKYLPWQAMYFLQRSTSFSKKCCRPFAASFRRIVEQAVSTFHVRSSVPKALPPLGNRRSSHCIVSIGLMDEFYRLRIESRKADAPLRKYLFALPS